MNSEQAKRLIRQTFEYSYDEGQFRLLIRNLLSDWKEEHRPAQSGALVSEVFRDAIHSFKRLGGFTDMDGREVDILTVKLGGNLSLERARTTQRNFVARYLDSVNRDAALVAFYSDDYSDWRFSLIKLEINIIENELGKANLHKNITPAKRFSFLVGEGEKSHTAQQRLNDVLTSQTIPNLSQLEHAFNIEVVTEEFFERYKDLFFDLRDDIEIIRKNNHEVESEFQKKRINSSSFAKRLLGQLVFLFFVQKKGWLGVNNSQKWGEGPKDFLRQLFNNKIIQYENFYNEILEPLFFQALAMDRIHDNHWFSHFGCRIPFLNGGLFEPINSYDWTNLHIPIPNNTMGKILDVFELYNFTVREDSPLDKEVAVDPEMLGKVFENLLDTNERKSQGAVYTPRAVVHFMAQEAIVDFLCAKIKISDTSLNKPADCSHSIDAVRDSVEYFVRFAGSIDPQDHYYNSQKYSVIPQFIEDNADYIDKLLRDIKILDPAIGSGAFPVGILIELVRCRHALSPFIKHNDPKRSIYDLKYHAIQENIYGVDINDSAIDIAKLRLWLSLIVDEENFEIVRPLPNLDYKFVVGDSLTKLRHLTDASALSEMHRLKGAYLFESSPAKKMALRVEISKLSSLIYSESKKWGAKSSFDIDIEFSQVMLGGGFDVVIGNPPYVIIGLDKFKTHYSNAFTFMKGKPDLYRMFVERCLSFISNIGQISFIIPNTILSMPAAEPLRRHLVNKGMIESLYKFNDSVFTGVSVNSIILRISSIDSSSRNSVNIIEADVFEDHVVKKKSIRYFRADMLKNNYIIPETIASAVRAEQLVTKSIKQTTLENIASHIVLGFQFYHNTIHSEDQINSKYLHINKPHPGVSHAEILGKDLIKPKVESKIARSYVIYRPNEYYTKTEVKDVLGRRIILREITGDRLVASYADDDFIVNKSCYVIKLAEGHDSLEDYYVLLATLVSSTTKEFVSSLGDKTNQKLFPRLSKRTIKIIPIPHYTIDQREELIRLMACMMSTNQWDNDILLKVDSIVAEASD
ncbi:N-6 DNA methylase [Deinococcus sp. 23YEL01]|uniref:Eco57I restriction-modification methylase domain-containing protein n=1 Tax=Deinococcus sp. 23YEL01 TaxID=2745871 RepID=UPI001E5B2159|nr:N-6 DNA methylase [Deinococcus sp. 23YEL01]MCD0168610.1 N-6 DNA methylase [Deinococcus sp. 23YEL01]